MHWLVVCTHFYAVIDRIESPMVVVEWADTGRTSDIPRTLVPGHAEEGDALLVHIRRDNFKLEVPEFKHPETILQSTGTDMEKGFPTSAIRISSVTHKELQKRLGSPTRMPMGAGKRRHESTTSNQRVGVSLSD